MCFNKRIWSKKWGGVDQPRGAAKWGLCPCFPREKAQKQEFIPPFSKHLPACTNYTRNIVGALPTHREIFLQGLFLTLSGIVSCDSDTDSNCAMRMACETSKPKPCETKPVYFPHFSLLVVRNRSWKCLNEGNFTLRFAWHRNVAIRVPRSTTVLPGSVTSIYFRFRINYRYIYITVTSN